jgi:hypothetical protein
MAINRLKTHKSAGTWKLKLPAAGTNEDAGDWANPALSAGFTLTDRGCRWK